MSIATYAESESVIIASYTRIVYLTRKWREIRKIIRVVSLKTFAND